MKTIFTKTFLFGIALVCAKTGFSQSLPPGQAAKFGIDGDIKSDRAAQGSFSASGSHDWFKQTGGTGNGLFDTAGQATYKTQIASGQNVSFLKKMQYPRYSVQDGILLLDASYTRDYYGIGPSDILNDKTVFVSTTRESNKNWQNPTTWTTLPTGGTVPNKSDIIDTYVNMRRNGTTIAGNNPSDLILTVGATTLGTGGDHYIDFELYRERINYNETTGKFETPAPAVTGGRSAWTFDRDGNITTFGDLTISYTFNNTQVQDIQVFIWIDYSTYKRMNTARFDFVQNSWNGASSRSGYGFAQIMPNGNYSSQAWGTVNMATTEGPTWGTSSKELGSQTENYAASGYSVGQFAEAGINLTAFGIDPVTYSTMDACNPPFTRFIVKTRSSSSFSSSLQDFIGPYEFLDAPTAPATINQPLTLTCAVNTVNLTPTDYLKGASYSWRTLAGNISSSNGDSSTIKIDKPGTYYLTAAMAKGCQTTLDSVIVYEDRFKPKASASATSPIVFPGSNILLLGGDPVQSNFSTPFGGSKGLTWKWTKQNDTLFSSVMQNPVITQPGDYKLTVTETRNGCTDIAYTSVGFGTTLPIKFTGFLVKNDKQKRINELSWQVADMTEVDKFIAEKSNNGVDFTPAGYVFGDVNYTAYSFKHNAIDGATHYRVKAVSKSGAVIYSSVVKTGSNDTQNNGLTAYAADAGKITLVYTSATSETVTIRLVGLNGQLHSTTRRNVVEGSNTLYLTEIKKPSGGIYLVLVEGQTKSASAKIAW